MVYLGSQHVYELIFQQILGAKFFEEFKKEVMEELLKNSLEDYPEEYVEEFLMETLGEISGRTSSELPRRPTREILLISLEIFPESTPWPSIINIQPVRHVQNPVNKCKRRSSITYNIFHLRAKDFSTTSLMIDDPNFLGQQNNEI